MTSTCSWGDRPVEALGGVGGGGGADGGRAIEPAERVGERVPDLQVGGGFQPGGVRRAGAAKQHAAVAQAFDAVEARSWAFAEDRPLEQCFGACSLMSMSDP
ncbi:MAG: hypothetical protein FJ404_01280 [Verrucomicrobia bacterium]|nr:hypothetical protein [Verrucomicrobiota bacterium]